MRDVLQQSCRSPTAPWSSLLDVPSLAAWAEMLKKTMDTKSRVAVQCGPGNGHNGVRRYGWLLDGWPGRA